MEIFRQETRHSETGHREKGAESGNRGLVRRCRSTTRVRASALDSAAGRLRDSVQRIRCFSDAAH